uniref:Protein SKIP34 n=1 Tax=Kalanchoe fedtschenkoi TaxID=63787 RepID=A0A7N0TTP1_KALFE
MCYGHQQPGGDEPRRSPARREAPAESVAVLNLRLRLAETEARLARARAREAELSRRLEEMKRFVSVMDIIEGFLKRRYRERQEEVLRMLTRVPRSCRER